MLLQHGLEQLCQLVVIHINEVLVVEPLALLEVKFGALAGAVVDAEFLDEFIHRENLTVVTGIPAEQCKEVDYRLGQISFLTIATGVFTALGVVPVEGEHREAQTVTVALAQFALAVGLEQQRQVDKFGHRVFPTEGLVQQHMQRGTGEPFFATDYVRHLHQVVVNNVGEVVGGQVVGTLVEHLVVKNR